MNDHSVIRDDHGQLIFSINLYQDVTERRMAEQRLTDSLESISEGFVLYDKNDKLVVCNSKYKEIYTASTEAILPGATFEEIIRYGVANGQYLEAQGREEEFIRERVAKHQNPTEVIEQPLAGGRWLRIEERKTKEGGIVGIRTDITQLKITEAELVKHRDHLEETVAERTKELELERMNAEAANKAKSIFLATMSHELRTPLNAIIGYSDMLMEEIEGGEPGEQLPDLEKIKGSGKHLLRLINDILDISKIETGQVELYLETTHIGDLVEDVVATAAPLIDQNENILEVIKTGDLESGITDTTRLRQVLFNLLSNAAKFTQNGTITLEATRIVGSHGDEFEFLVTDTGIGIPEDKLDAIFDAFMQADASIAREYGGTGLGLPITRRLCEMMGGYITVRSTPGKETVFTVRVPVEVTAPVSQQKAVKSSTTESDPDNRARVLAG